MPISRSHTYPFRLNALIALCLLTAGQAQAGEVTDFEVVNNAMTTWRIDGLDNPPLTLLRGKTYTFSMQGVSAVHPFNINTTNTTGSANLYNEGVTNNGASGSQVLTFVVPGDAPDSLHYNCGNHGSMNGPITILTDEIFAAGFD
jgi:hypothetical protein